MVGEGDSEHESEEMMFTPVKCFACTLKAGNMAIGSPSPGPPQNGREPGIFFYQPGTRETRARLLLRLLYVPAFVCVCVCVRPQLSRALSLRHSVTMPL